MYPRFYLCWCFLEPESLFPSSTMALIKEIHGVHVYLKKVDYTSSGEKEEQFKSVVPTFFGTRDWLHGRQIFHRWGEGWFQDDSSTTMGSSCTYRWSFADFLLPTSCCVAWFLTGHRLVLVCGLGARDPWFKWFWQVCPPSHSADLCFRMSRSQEAGICCSNLLFPPALNSGLPSHESPFPGKGDSSV